MTALYDLLPEVYRRHDAEQGHPLRALLAVIEEQRTIVSDEIDGLYDDWFVETCADGVLPHLGGVVGYQALPGYEEALGTGTEPGLARAVAPRRDVADTIANRRRKGTLAVLEELAADVAGWPARAVEPRLLLGRHQPVRLWGTDPAEQRRRGRAGRLADMRRGDALARVDGPFDELAHLVDVRALSSHRTPGRCTLPGVALFVWRLGAYSITGAPAYCRDRRRRTFTVSILGNDTPLLTRPVREPGPTHVAGETNVPAFIRRRAFADRTAAYYGPGKSLCVYLADDADDAGGSGGSGGSGGGPRPVPLDRIVAADLSDWTYTPARGQVAVDPELGRVAFPARYAPEGGVWVTYHHGFSADIGGGEYPRAVGPATPYRVGPGEAYTRITDALAAWRADKGDGSATGVVELVGSLAHQEQLEIRLDDGDRLTIRAAAGARPVLRLLDWYSNRPDALRVVATGSGPEDAPPPRLVLDGLLVTGRSVRVEGPLGRLDIRDCTLVPGWSIDERCGCEHPGEPALELVDTPACVQIERSILGAVLVDRDEVRCEPAPIVVSDSVLDAGADGGGCALSGPEGRAAHAVLSARRTTVLGRVSVRGVDLVENSILGTLRVLRRQHGCVRFCYLAPGSQPPPHFHCEPELSGEPERVVPVFVDRRYGTPGYAQLGARCADEIRAGADDGSEMGAFHDLFAPQRTENLRRRLDEYLPAGDDAGLIFVT